MVKNFKPNLILLGHADSIKPYSLEIVKKEYPEIKIAQWFLDRMDTKWKNNKLRFLDKIKHMDYSFCTTDPKALKMQNKSTIKLKFNC